MSTATQIFEVERVAVGRVAGRVRPRGRAAEIAAGFSAGRARRDIFGRPGRRPLRVGAFTIIEVLLGLAIIGLIAGILITGSAALLQDKPVAVRDVFWAAVEQARENALRQGREVRLRYFDDRETGKGFELLSGESAKPFVLSPEVATSDLKVDFLTTQKGGNVILVAGVMVETQTVPYVTFYPDGTCTAFRLQIVRGGGTEMLSIDPWTCAEMLTPPDPNAPTI